MRLEQYLLEASSYPTKKQLKDNLSTLLPSMSQNEFDVDAFFKIWSSIKKDCKPAIEYMKAANNYIYRGMKTGGNLGEKSTRSDRMPKDTSMMMHNLIDEVMEDQYGWKPRSEGLFCTGDRYGTESYGNKYIIFPVGKFEYIWSPNVRDSYSQFGDSEMMDKLILKDAKAESLSQMYSSIYGPSGTLGHKGSWTVYGKGLETLATIEQKDAPTREKAMQIVKSKFNLKDVGLVEWEPELQQYQWISKVRSEGFSGKKPTPEMYKDLIEELLDKQFKYQEAGIVNALKSGNEIIVKTPKYYYLRYSIYGLAMNYMLDAKGW